jgi:hypothetical protein
MARAEKYPNGGTGGWNLPKKGGLRIKQPKIVSQSDMRMYRKNSEPIREPRIVSQSDMRLYKKPKFDPQPLENEEVIYPKSNKDTVVEAIESPTVKLVKKNKKWLVLGVVAVAGFIAYKKFKK